MDTSGDELERALALLRTHPYPATKARRGPRRPSPKESVRPRSPKDPIYRRALQRLREQVTQLGDRLGLGDPDVKTLVSHELLELTAPEATRVHKVQRAVPEPSHGRSKQATPAQVNACRVVFEAVNTHLVRLCGRFGLDSQQALDVIHPELMQLVSRDIRRKAILTRMALLAWTRAVSRNAALTLLKEDETRQAHETLTAPPLDNGSGSSVRGHTPPDVEEADDESGFEQEADIPQNAGDDEDERSPCIDLPQDFDETRFWETVRALSAREKRLLIVIGMEPSSGEHRRVSAAEMARVLGWTVKTYYKEHSLLRSKLRKAFPTAGHMRRHTAQTTVSLALDVRILGHRESPEWEMWLRELAESQRDLVSVIVGVLDTLQRASAAAAAASDVGGALATELPLSALKEYMRATEATALQIRLRWNDVLASLARIRDGSAVKADDATT